jgi:hypothetical protein
VGLNCAQASCSSTSEAEVLALAPPRKRAFERILDDVSEAAAVEVYGVDGQQQATIAAEHVLARRT